MISETDVLLARYRHMGQVNEIYFGISFTSQSIFTSTILSSSLYMERSIGLITDVRHIRAICRSAKSAQAIGTLSHTLLLFTSKIIATGLLLQQRNLSMRSLD